MSSHNVFQSPNFCYCFISEKILQSALRKITQPNLFQSFHFREFILAGPTGRFQFAQFGEANSLDTNLLCYSIVCRNTQVCRHFGVS